MPIYGRYEVVERLHASPSVTVSRARLVDGKQPVFVVKIFQPAGIALPELRAQSAAFLDRVKLQEQLGARPNSNWAPIRHSGTVPTGAYYVVDLYPATLQSVIAQQAPLGPQALDKIVSGVVAALSQLHSTFHRAHGDLKASNILLDRKRLADARVLLTDPAPPAEAKAAGSAADLRALGAIIHQLILGRPFATGEPWPVPDGPQWEALGSAGRHWQKLCSDLLSVKPAAGMASLAEVRKALDEIESVQRRPAWTRLSHRARVAIAASVAGAMLGSAAVCVLDYSARRQLADARKTWLNSFAQAINDPSRRKQYDADPALRAARTDLDAVQVSTIDPAPALSSLQPWNYLHTRARLTAAQRTLSDLSPQHWQKLANLQTLADKFGERGWVNASNALRSIIGQVKPSPDLAVALDRVLSTDAHLRRDLPAMDADWDDLGAHAHELSETGDPFLTAAGAMYQNQARSAIALSDTGLSGRDAIHVQAGNIQQLLDVLHNGYAVKYDRSRIQTEVAGKMDLGHLTPKDVQTWKDRLPDYLWRREATASAVAELDARVKQKAAAIKATNPAPADAVALGDALNQIGASLRAFDKTSFVARDINDGTFAARRKRIEAQIDALSSISSTAVALAPTTAPVTPKPPRTTPPPPTVAVKPTTAPSTRAVAVVTPPPAPTTAPVTPPVTVAPTTRTYAAADPPKIVVVPPPIPAPQTKPVEVRPVEVRPVVPDVVKPPVVTPPVVTPPVVAAPQTPAEWIKSLPLIGGSSDVIAAYWEDWKHVLQNSTAEMSSKPQLFTAMKTQTNGLHDALLDLGKTFPPAPANLSAPFTAVAVERREREIGKALSQIDPKNVRPGLPVVRQAAETYARWEKQLVALADDFPLRSQILRLGQRPDQKWEKLDPQFWSDPSIAALVKKDVDRIHRVADLSRLSRSDLADAAASSTVMEVTVAAWELLGSPDLAPQWPTRPGELEAERDLRQKIGAMVKMLQSPDEQAALNATLNEQGPARWTRFAEAANSEQMLASAIDLRPVFGDQSKLAAGLDTAARFNLALYQARQLSRSTDDAGARQIATTVAQSAGDLPNRTPVTLLMTRLATLDTPERLAAQNPGERYTLSVPGADGGIVFQRVQPVETRPFYLQTVDVSVGQFIGVVTAGGAWDRISLFGWGAEPGKRDARRGPRSWEWTQRPSLSMTVPLLWLTPDDDNDYLPIYRMTRFNRTALSDDVGGNPLPDHPMQQIPAEAALFYAAMCQSRLPTTAEWKEAYAIFERTVPTERWNLRDQTFDAQRKYVASITGATQRWPDEAIYRPVGSNAPSGIDATSRPEHDGSLFFRTVSAPGGGTFHQLVGNVAQFVCDAPEAFEAWPDKQTVDGIRKFIQAYPSSLHVIGGSALSPPEVPFDKPMPLARADQGYSDVGLRLAFTAPSRSVAERLRWVLAGQKYLWEKSESASTTAPSEAVAR